MDRVNVQKIEPILDKYGVVYAGLFGSHSRGEANEDSDIDILVKLKEPLGLFDFAGFKNELSEKLGIEVDLLTEGFLSPYIKDNVMHDLKIFYGKK
ncbi:MAG: DNA polymerase subunit beta [Parcubacteria group bacterium Licking1014_17]|nr:MAG: DNA polymerase subunit beta [Parcubacteria group bacterium Licking1014_17]